MYLRIKNEVSRSRLSKVKAPWHEQDRHIDRQTDATEHISTATFADGNNGNLQYSNFRKIKASASNIIERSNINLVYM